MLPAAVHPRMGYPRGIRRLTSTRNWLNIASYRSAVRTPAVNMVGSHPCRPGMWNLVTRLGQHAISS